MKLRPAEERPTPALTDLDELLSRLGGTEALTASARAHGAFTRAREVKTAIDLLRLVLTYGPGGLSLRSAATVAAEGGLCDLSDVALMKRIRRAADWLEALCAEQISLVDAALGEAMGAITLVDASLIQSPGTGTNYRLHLQWDVTQQRSVAARITTKGRRAAGPAVEHRDLHPDRRSRLSAARWAAQHPGGRGRCAGASDLEQPVADQP